MAQYNYVAKRKMKACCLTLIVKTYLSFDDARNNDSTSPYSPTLLHDWANAHFTHIEILRAMSEEDPVDNSALYDYSRDIWWAMRAWALFQLAKEDDLAEQLIDSIKRTWSEPELETSMAHAIAHVPVSLSCHVDGTCMSS